MIVDRVVVAIVIVPRKARGVGAILERRSLRTKVAVSKFAAVGEQRLVAGRRARPPVRPDAHVVVLIATGGRKWLCHHGPGAADLCRSCVLDKLAHRGLQGLILPQACSKTQQSGSVVECSVWRRGCSGQCHKFIFEQLRTPTPNATETQPNVTNVASGVHWIGFEAES